MPYPELLALIDSKIERLRYARELLTTSVLSEILVDVERYEPMPVRQAEEQLLPVALEPVSEEALQKVRQILPRARRERRVVARAKQLEPSALRGHLPAGPVFVPAMRLVKPESGTTSVSADPFEKPTDLPTAAQLTQRWLHASS